MRYIMHIVLVQLFVSCWVSCVNSSYLLTGSQKTFTRLLHLSRILYYIQILLNLISNYHSIMYAHLSFHWRFHHGLHFLLIIFFSFHWSVVLLFTLLSYLFRKFYVTLPGNDSCFNNVMILKSVLMLVVCF